MIEVFKFQSGLYKTDRPVFNRHSGRDTRGHCKKLDKERCSREIRRNFFSQRVVSAWNGLPESVVTAPSVNAFKNRFDAHWKNDPSIYDPDCYH